MFALSCSQNALTGITGAVDTFRDGTVNSGNAVTWAGFAGKAQLAAGAEAITFTQTPAQQMIAVAFEVIQ